MSEQNKTEYEQKNFVICDSQTEYSEKLFQFLMRRYPDEYQFHIFYGIENMRNFSDESHINILLVSEEYEETVRQDIRAERIYVLSEQEREKENKRYIFRYQSAGKIMDHILSEKRFSSGKVRACIRDEPYIRGIIGVYSPVHRIGKTKFAIRLGIQTAERYPVLYLNMEGCSGLDHYFPDNPEADMSDLLYYIRQNDSVQGMKISTMTGQIKGMDYIFPMKNEVDFRSVKEEEWILLLNVIKEKCIYKNIILDIGDGINGLYEILRMCSRIYIPYIEEDAAIAKVDQYERNLREAGYTDILSRSVKRRMKKSRYQDEKNGGTDETYRTTL